MMRSTVVSDASSLIVIIRLERIDLLENQFDKVIIPKRVKEEIIAKEDDIAQAIASNSLFEVCESHNIELLEILDGILDYGEVEALALAKELAHILLIDEKKGRKIALGLNIKIIGFLGVLLLNYNQGKLNKGEVKAIISKAKSFQFRLSEKLETRFFTLLG